MDEQWRRRRRRCPWTSRSINEDSDGRLHLFLAELAAAMAAASYGLSVGYSSPALPDMRRRMQLTESQSSWFGSLLNIGALVGGLVGGKFIYD
ncbi:hypothetical protein MRX96_049405 [Rhipicephalus microplus]